MEIFDKPFMGNSDQKIFSEIENKTMQIFILKRPKTLGNSTTKSDDVDDLTF